MEKTIYDLELHECLKTQSMIDVMRVPGGWIYGNSNNMVFIPYNKEFKKCKHGNLGVCEECRKEVTDRVKHDVQIALLNQKLNI